MTVDATRRVCAVCGFVLLAVVTDAGTSLLVHRDGPVDHAAMVVDSDSLLHYNQRCDFCDVLSVTWIVTADDFEMPMTFTGVSTSPGGGSSRSVGHWAACDTCAGYVRRHAWSSLVTYVRLTNDSVRPDVVLGQRVGGLSRRHLHALYGRLQAHMREVVPIDEWRQRVRQAQA